MILFFEGKDYKRKLLEHYFGVDHSKVITYGNFRDDKAMLDCVGYYYSPSHSHIFILPKVFITNGKGFGYIEIKEDTPINETQNLAKELKDEGWKADILSELPIYLYQAIEKYRKRERETSIIEKDTTHNILSSKKRKNETTLMDIILSLRDFYKENQNLFILTYKQIHSGFNKVNWSKTIRKHQPFISENKVIYPFVVNHRKEINYDEELLVLFFNSLRYINKEYQFNIDVNQPYNLIPEKEFKRKLENGTIKKRLETIKNNYFNEKLVLLWELLYLFAIKKADVKSSKEKEEYLIVRDFNKVFEDMIDSILGDNDAPKELVKQKDGKIIDHLFQGLSLTTTLRPIYYVGDSKYYKENATPVDEALFKQYTYARNIIQTQLDWYHKNKPHIKYRDELTEGYNITPNFFISGSVKKEYTFTQPELHLQDYTFEKSFQYRNRIFDRDTLFLRMYDINFLYVLYAYVSRAQSIKSNFKKQAKEQFRLDFINFINKEYDFYLMQQREEGNIQTIINKHFRTLNGKAFCPYGKEDEYYGLIILGLERGKNDENSRTLACLSKDFIIKEYHLGTEPYIYYKGLLLGKECSRTMTLQTILKDEDGNYRRESVIIGGYNSDSEKKDILENHTYKIRLQEDFSGVTYQRCQQIYTPSILLLYDATNLGRKAEGYTLNGSFSIVEVHDNKNERLLIYNIEDKLGGEIDVEDIVTTYSENGISSPIFLYFTETESIKFPFYVMNS